MPIFILSEQLVFPTPHLATPEGLLAVGGDLSPERLLLAYRQGIFPWFSDEEPLLWWSPDPRLVLYPEELKVSKSLKKTIKHGRFHITADTSFDRVIKACALVKRNNNEGTWIVDEMIKAYSLLHEAGFAHSIEAWYQGELAGGLYGVSLGRCFFGESMFTHVSNASKAAFVRLVEYLKRFSFDFIDCQVTTKHLVSLGAREIPRSRFLGQLKESLKLPAMEGKWTELFSKRL
ncbi:leucyl/phenylalanyl-tRNA---protein transferase [Desulfosarcina sp. BuS5]|uniref:leucyl/phenylalanyl-tRNA--protein transferase n=1 Tax=Desulfosarcina sp. BuS5 TaxID=933262 RepID=UPI00047FDBAA|nr:leucyl/phenylalanyl-tRNA--protein transferase [Desulfosarcina sp. BuS5]WDN89077.1 leucyl/phenylalanyl-tRNA---protein transferase [Desulfosarcina sp. BuS5]